MKIGIIMVDLQLKFKLSIVGTNWSLLYVDRRMMIRLSKNLNDIMMSLLKSQTPGGSRLERIYL